MDFCGGLPWGRRASRRFKVYSSLTRCETTFKWVWWGRIDTVKNVKPRGKSFFFPTLLSFLYRFAFNSLTLKPIRRWISCYWKKNIDFWILSNIYCMRLFCLSDFYAISDIQDMQISDGLTHYVNHFCLLERIISWLPLAELGAETIWFPCVYFALASVKVVQSDFTGRHYRRAGLKSPSLSVCASLCVYITGYGTAHHLAAA